MNLLLFTPEDYIAVDRVKIVDSEKLAHIEDVLKKKEGDSLRAGVTGGRCGTAKILSIESGTAILEVDLSCDPPAPLPLTMVCALPRPKVFRRILFCAACMGVKKFHFIKTWRVDKSYWESPLLLPGSIQKIFTDALSQCGDTILPEITFHRLFRPFVEDRLQEISGESRKLLAHPYARDPFPFQIGCAATLLIGPEGGFIPFEVDLLNAGGFLPVSIGRRILTVENAVASLIPRLYP